ncbi:unnamed protein product [Brassica oleracea]
MEDDLQRPYFVCTRDDLKEKMNKQINDISEIFCVSNSDVTALLMKLRWNSQLLSERLCQENNKLSTESGFVTDSNQDLSHSDSSCDDVDDKVSTPFCSHQFSINYWSKYLEKNKKKYTISCPLQGCPAEVEWDAIENLTVRKKNSFLILFNLNMDDDDLQRPYSVCTRDDLKERITKQIDVISEIFCVSNSDATVLLMKLRWNSQLLSERLSQENKKLLTESGLKPVVVTDSNQDLSDSSCDEFYEFFDDVDDDDVKVSTPFCSHKFSTTYWSKYLDKNFFSVEKTLDTISCPHQDCGAAVGRDTIEKLTVKDKNRYDEYVLRSYLDTSKRQVKQCPAQGCSYFIEFHKGTDAEEYGLNVVCLCGHTFCCRCSLETHRPVTCNNASDWLSRDLQKLSEASDKSLSFLWIEANTEPCPHCLSPVEIGLGSLDSKFVPCGYCSGSFCWDCMHSEESHKTESGTYGDCLEPVEQDPLWNVEVVDTSCLDRWEACEVSLAAMEGAQDDLQDFEDYIIKNPDSLKEQDVRIVREGLMLLIQCRQVLKWSCVYEYFHTEHETSKKEYLQFLQDIATTTLQSYLKTLLEETETAFYAADALVLCKFRHNLTTATSNVGNFFYHFIKTLQDGIVDVKVKSYDNVAGPYWLCDRCTYGNSWLDMKCKMCCEATTSKPSDLSHKWASKQSYQH